MTFAQDHVSGLGHTVGRLLDDDVEWARRASEASSFADALYGVDMATAAVNRMLGWLENGIDA